MKTDTTASIERCIDIAEIVGKASSGADAGPRRVGYGVECVRAAAAARDELAALTFSALRLREFELTVARVTGITCETDGRAPEPGPHDAILGALEQMRRDAHDYHQQCAAHQVTTDELEAAEAELTRLRALLASGQVVDLARIPDGLLAGAMDSDLNFIVRLGIAHEFKRWLIDTAGDLCGVTETVRAKSLDPECAEERDARAACRLAAQILIEEIGAPGPETVVETATRAVEIIRSLRAIPPPSCEFHNNCTEADVLERGLSGFNAIHRWKGRGT